MLRLKEPTLGRTHSPSSPGLSPRERGADRCWKPGPCASSSVQRSEEPSGWITETAQRETAENNCGETETQRQEGAGHGQGAPSALDPQTRVGI